MKVLGNSECCVRGYDVSARFLELCEHRCAGLIEQQRLTLHQLAADDPAELVNDLERCGWIRSIDAFYSIDAMVHVDLQYLIVYLITAALSLKPGGTLLLTLADATRDAGFAKLIRDISWTFPVQGRPMGSGKFEWLSPDIVASILPRLGFTITHLGAGHRDMRVVAELTDPARAQDFAPALRKRTM
jgi:hypothetical protein